MGKYFWPIYVAVASVSCALVWRFAPALGARLPPEVRARICNAVDSTTTAFSGEAVEQKTDTADAVAASSDPPVTNVTKRVPLDPNRPPAQRGVRPVDSIDAAWGVLTGITPVEDLDGKVVAKLPGGRFFMIKKTISTQSGPMLIGRFLPQKRPGDIRVSIGNVSCFSGLPSYLSTNQQNCLRMYYQLTGEAEKLKARLMLDAAKGSPYLKAAADALHELEEKEKSVEKLKKADADTQRKATYELSQLRTKVEELNQKHKEWKEEHAAELPDPEKDPAYIELLRQREKYREPIKDLLFAS